MDFNLLSMFYTHSLRTTHVSGVEYKIESATRYFTTVKTMKKINIAQHKVNGECHYLVNRNEVTRGRKKSFPLYSVYCVFQHHMQNINA